MSTYLQAEFTRHIDSPSVIFEVGAHNGWDSIQLLRHFGAKQLHSFECNPEAIYLAEETYKYHDTNHQVIFNKCALWRYEGTTSFYPVKHSYMKHLNPTGDPSKFEKNIGMSSCFRESGIYGEKIIQDEITVPCTTLDSYCSNKKVNRIDLMCMDVQGGEYDILSSSPRMLCRTNFIIAEMNKIEVYAGQATYAKLKAYLETFGFEMIEFVYQCNDFGDGLFKNTKFNDVS